MENKELVEKNRISKNEISGLRAKLNEINEQKEIWFEKKEDLKNEISKLIRDVKEVKRDKDKFNSEIKDLKKQRDKFNSEVKKLVVRFKKLDVDKREAMKKYGVRSDPTKIKEEIEKLEFSIEIDALSLEKEKKVMDKIKQFKKLLNEVSSVKVIVDELDNISKNIDISKEKAEELHKKIQNYATESQKRFEKFIEVSNKINELTKKQEEAFEKFLNFKKDFVATNNTLKDKLIESSKIQEELSKSKAKKIKVLEEEKKKTLKEMTEEVENKLKKKQKLTTEDLLVFQEGNGDK